MFIGHFAAGLALKRLAPETNLGWFIAAVCFLDLIWPFFLLAGLESVQIDPGNTAFTPLNFVSYPYSHSLLMAVIWSLVVGGVYFLAKRYRSGAIAIGIGVISHWFLDAIVHRPDLPLYPGGAGKVGLGVWNSIPATLILESLMFLAGVWIYIKTTRAKDRVGSFAFWTFVLILLFSYVANVLSPPPSSAELLPYFAPLVWIYVALGAWGDKHREPSLG